MAHLTEYTLHLVMKRQSFKSFKIHTWQPLLGQAWASPTLAWLHCARMCISMDWPLTINFKWAHSNISQRSISWSMWRPCQSAALGTRSDDDRSWSMRSTGLCFYRRPQAAHRRYKFNMDGSLQLFAACSGSPHDDESSPSYLCVTLVCNYYQH